MTKKSCDGEPRERERGRDKRSISTTAVSAAAPTVLHSGGHVLSSPPFPSHTHCHVELQVGVGGGGQGKYAEDKQECTRIGCVSVCACAGVCMQARGFTSVVINVLIV